MFRMTMITKGFMHHFMWLTCHEAHEKAGTFHSSPSRSISFLPDFVLAEEAELALEAELVPEFWKSHAWNMVFFFLDRCRSNQWLH